MGQTHAGNTVTRRVKDETADLPRRRIKLAHRRHRLIARWSQYESSSEDDVSGLSPPRSVYNNESGSIALKKLQKLSQSYSGKLGYGSNPTLGSGDNCEAYSITSTVEQSEARSSRISETTFSSAETLVADDESTLKRVTYRSNEIIFRSSRSLNEVSSVIRPLPTEDSAEVRVAEVKNSPESDVGPETEMVGDVARLTVLTEDINESAISWKLGANDEEKSSPETTETTLKDGVSVEVSSVPEPSSVIPVPGSGDASEHGITIPANAIFGSSKRRKRTLAGRSRSCKLATDGITTVSPAASPPTVPKRPASRPPRPAEKTWLKSGHLAQQRKTFVQRENERNRQQAAAEEASIWGHRRTKSVAASHMIDRQTNISACHRRAVSMRDSIVDNDRAYNLLKCLDSGLRLWCKLSSDGYDSSILISDKTGNLLEVADDTQTTVICRMDGAVRCRVDISEAICV
ncbi:uncharacterized protein LOC110974139 [Acanthaster planci]|uniref:Uncharacterized protein LOC110974139 n=1 Tax=Acanthaster planci TaxID=133434 RepID=A0A8B7XM28_ACAPL|nr:uncharacterized protein LOC110974139 [Acanthaster planci]